VGRKAWIWTLLALALAAVLVAAWLDGGTQPLRWIEQPVAVPSGAA
jgi:hypothetical protein